MSRCSHPNAVITEHVGGCSSSWMFLRGELAEDWSTFGGPTGRLDVICNDCGLDRSYWRSRPVWLVTMMDKVENR